MVTVAGLLHRLRDATIAVWLRQATCPPRCSHLPGMTQLFFLSEGARPATVELPSCTKEDADRYQRRAGQAPLGTVGTPSQNGPVWLAW